MDGSNINSFDERHFTINELSKMRFLVEFVRQIVRDEPGVSEWVRQQAGRRRYRVLRVPQSVVERLYRRALTRAEGSGRGTLPRTGDTSRPEDRSGALCEPPTQLNLDSGHFKR